MQNLIDLTPVQCEDMVFLSAEEVRELHAQIPGWKLSDDGKAISRSCSFPDFAEALAFADKVGEVAEEVFHHPILTVSWGSVAIEITTHSLGGLSLNDFVLAARIEALSSGNKV